MIFRRLSVRQLILVAILLIGCFYIYRSAYPAETLVVVRSTAPDVPVEKSLKPPSEVKNIFGFGDSLTETMFVPEYDMPTAQKPFGTDFPGHTSAGGPNWLGWLFQDHLDKALVYNLALGGAQVSSAEFNDGDPLNRDFVFQLNQFMDAYEADKLPEWHPDSTLFATWFGTNDVHGGFMRWFEFDLHDKILAHYFSQLQRLVDVGAKYFLAMTPEPVELTLWHKYGTGYANKKLAYFVEDWNRKLKMGINDFQKKTNTRIFFVDVTTLVTQALADKKAKACTVMEEGGSGDVCMWQDQFHLGVIPHHMIADKIWEELNT